METIVVGGAGFLLAVLWFDLMFDVQARDPSPSIAAIDSIARYNRRVTTDAAPMGRLVGVAMGVTLAGIAGEITSPEHRWTGVASLVLALPPFALAGARILPAAKRLGLGDVLEADRPTVARSILRWHVYSFVSMVGLVAVQAISIAG